MIPYPQGEVILTGLMTCNVGMVINGGPKMFFKSFPEGP